MNHPRPPSRVARWLILILLVAIGIGGVLAKIAANRALKISPVGYVVALEENTRVRLRWKSRALVTSHTVIKDSPISIPAGKKVLVIHTDGQMETVAGPARIQISTSPASPVDFLSAPLNDLLAQPKGEVPSAENIEAIHVTSPAGVTRFLSPLITWNTQKGLTYDVAVVDPADEAAPPRTRRGVLPPVPLATLETPQSKELPTDRIFAVLVRKSGDSQVLGTSRFLTSSDATNSSLPTTAPELMQEAVAALAQKPARTGDAWLALSRLPEPWRQSELGIRLRLKVATELGLKEELTQLREELRKL